ncbi:MAG: response regulator transcription factor [Acidobacteriia bacterium]|nr:response regulator transcription factor [Terriglobia bacterium]
MASQFKALVIDDERPLRAVLRTSLTARGFVVEEAGSGEEALEILGHRKFDIALLDINMPGMGGLEACRQIREIAPQMGIVMATVRDAEADMVSAFELGADDYVTKPFRFGELIARLHAVLRRTDPTEAPVKVLRTGNLEIDFERRSLLRSGGEVRLTPTEFDLLAMLMKNEGVPLTHAKLLSSIWGAEYRDELEYLRSYIRALRKKIEDDPSQPKYILTEPWLGYRFQNPFQTEVTDSEQ